ncbi:MAG: ACP S-malonyltransferase [Gemmatimonadetes bacterium]|nr:ACP S-malonyltransferase [Gemmatimonadota bacterium]MBK6779023.1 ACP S-malonyltransferase [Gemmatimonadota bacterium]MBK7348666.1 ACP S-malonyltransferase [Gemmatimonadota bacterium]MBK7714230.1 ACP S-malonyltransferase [Gemmatimonadota bacterium]MBK7783294.1 ACP S-malonyltransferase [Gemmatimonadota bacterium]
MCPGQGAQRVGMGKDLAERFPEARDTFARIDDALGVALSRIMWEGPEAELTLTHNTQPAILAHSAAVWAVVGERLGPTLRAAAGHSLGEYSAYVAAGALDAASAARLVRRRGELMYEAGTRRPGAMAAVLGLDTAQVEAACAEASTGAEVAVAANLNAPDQTVLSGDPAAVERAGAGCKARGAKRVIGLKVSGAFHSPLMEPAVAGLAEALAGATFADPRVPIVANASAEPVATAARARALLAAQLTAPVRWVGCMQQAAVLAPGATFVEVGPGNVLAGLLKRIVPGAPTLTLGTADDVETFLTTS